jgi:hypothetical protein
MNAKQTLLKFNYIKYSTVLQQKHYKKILLNWLFESYNNNAPHKGKRDYSSIFSEIFNFFSDVVRFGFEV